MAGFASLPCCRAGVSAFSSSRPAAHDDELVFGDGLRPGETKEHWVTCG